MKSVKAVSHIGAISFIILILGISAVGLYFSYSASNHSTTTIQTADAVSLQSFSLNPGTSNLTGSIKVNSNSPLARMTLYVNGTFMGAFNYSNHYGMMSTMIGSYPYAYSMMYSWNPGSMPMMRDNQFMPGRTY